MQDIVVPKRQEGTTLPDTSARPRRSIREITRDTEPMRPGSPVTQQRSAPAPEIVSVPSVFSPEPRPTAADILDPEHRDGAQMPPRHEEPLTEELAEHGRPRRGTGVWLAALVSSLLLIVAASNYFYGANVHITPMTATAEIAKELTARTDGGAGSVRFETVSFSQDLEATVKATGEAEVARKASGTIVIYNSYGPAAQRLIKNTRFETPEGKIYRIDESVTVPGVQGTAKTPGQIEVRVYADAPGKEYNIGLSDFTIPGFKGDPRYEKIFAKSKTEMTGGALGMMKVVSDEEKTATLERLKGELATTLATQAKAQAPQGFVLLNGATDITYEEIEKTRDDLGKDEALVAIRGTVRATLLSEVDLAAVLAPEAFGASGYLPEKHRGTVRITNPDTLTMAPNSELPLEGTDEFSFTLSGTATFSWDVDLDRLAQELAGTPLANFDAFVRENYPSIARAGASRTPVWAFWANTFPESPEDIDVEVDE